MAKSSSIAFLGVHSVLSMWNSWSQQHNAFSSTKYKSSNLPETKLEQHHRVIDLILPAVAFAAVFLSESVVLLLLFLNGNFSYLYSTGKLFSFNDNCTLSQSVTLVLIHWLLDPAIIASLESYTISQPFIFLFDIYKRRGCYLCSAALVCPQDSTTLHCISLEPFGSNHRSCCSESIFICLHHNFKLVLSQCFSTIVQQPLQLWFIRSLCSPIEFSIGLADQFFNFFQILCWLQMYFDPAHIACFEKLKNALQILYTGFWSDWLVPSDLSKMLWCSSPRVSTTLQI